MKKQILAVLIGAPLLALAIVPVVRSQTTSDYTSKPAAVDKSVTANFAASVTRFFPAATEKVASVFKEAVDNPKVFSKRFVFKKETPFTVTLEGPMGRQNVQTTFKDFQEAVFAVVPKDQQLFVASTLLGISSAFRDSCVFIRFALDGSIAHVGIEGTAYVPGEVSPTPRGSITVSPASIAVAKRFASALRGKSVNFDYGIADGIQ